MFNSKPVLRKYFWENDNLKAPSSDLVLHFYSDGGLPKDKKNRKGQNKRHPNVLLQNIQSYFSHNATHKRLIIDPLCLVNAHIYELHEDSFLLQTQIIAQEHGN